MANVNKVTLIGNLTRDPELKYTSSGKAVAEISIAVNRKWRDEGGNPKEETTFVELQAWGKTAELAQQYLTKGKQCYFEGRLKMDTWEDKDTGQKRSKMRVVVEDMQFLGNKSDGGKQAQPTPSPASNAADDDLEEIPF